MDQGDSYPSLHFDESSAVTFEYTRLYGYLSVGPDEWVWGPRWGIIATMPGGHQRYLVLPKNWVFV